MPQTDPLDPDRIQANLRTQRVGRKVLVYDSTSSTNDVAAEYARNPESDGLVVFAEAQTAGRGRAGSTWAGGRAAGILCSIVLTPQDISAEILSLASAVAVAEAVGRPGKHSAKVKWPNDILIDGKKVAGILLESKTFRDRDAFILGIGINCHQQPDSFGPDLKGRATSIDIETASRCDRIPLARRLLTSLDHWLPVARRNAPEVVERWRHLSIQLGHRVTKAPNGEVGLTRFRECPTDLVITDIYMPEKEGIATIRELLTEDPELKIIAISGGGDFGRSSLSTKVDYLKVAKRVGASSVLTKPIEWEELAEAVGDLLR